MFPARLLLRRPLFRFLCSDPNPNASSDPPQSLRRTLNSLLRLDDLDQLAADFKNFSADRNFRSKDKIYEIVVRRLTAAGRLDAVDDILVHQKRYADAISDEGFAVRVICLYGYSRMPDRAAAMFGELPDLGCPRTVFSFNAVLTAYSRSKASCRIDAMRDFISSHSASISPNLVSYNILINALCEEGLHDDALKTLDLMAQRDVSPSVITFNTLLNGFYKKGNISMGDEIWKRMVDAGVSPDVRSFNSKIRGFVSAGMIPEAFEALEELRRSDLQPDSHTFNALMKGFLLGGKLEEAKRIFEEMGKNGCLPDRITLRQFIPKLCHSGEVNLALELCRNGILKGFVVDVSLVKKVVDLLVKDSRYVEAKKLVFLARRKKKNVKLSMPLPCLAAWVS
ncbi:Pentatricopeptide repeat-containing protein [Apostasia shenzhenica]|uniref:Pentatricopeptide repeat-containing protein n=1 Tax=Apostasia shenzhenica TaxID=1088818 RepID=A0A2I0B345_9ASPA|nr:Pentatricopeptide repeat-containing protein [Apostasia shenzhenica]